MSAAGPTPLRPRPWVLPRCAYGASPDALWPLQLKETRVVFILCPVPLPAFQPSCVLLSVHATMAAVPVSGHSLTPMAPHRLPHSVGPSHALSSPSACVCGSDKRGGGGQGHRMPCRARGGQARPASRPGTGFRAPSICTADPAGPPSLEAGPVQGRWGPNSRGAVGSGVRGPECRVGVRRAGTEVGLPRGRLWASGRTRGGLQSSGAGTHGSRGKPGGRVGEPGWDTGEASEAGHQVPGLGRVWGGP